MTISAAREVLARASGSLRGLKGGLRRSARAAIKHARGSGRRTLHDMELALLVERMLASDGARWPAPHEVGGAVLFEDDARGGRERREFLVELRAHGRKFKVEHEVGHAVVKVGR